MTNDTLAEAARAAHDWGLASWLGGSMYGQFALNPSVARISDHRERGKVVNAAWNGYNAINAVSLGAVAVVFQPRVHDRHPGTACGGSHEIWPHRVETTPTRGIDGGALARAYRAGAGGSRRGL